MTSRDVRDILSLGPSQGPLPSTSKPKALSRPPGTGPKRRAGISRELYNLIGDNSPSLALSYSSAAAKPKFKERPKLGKGVSGDGGGRGRVRWVWRKFRNQARKDNLRLGHWVRTVVEEGKEEKKDEDEGNKEGKEGKEDAEMEKDQEGKEAGDQESTRKEEEASGPTTADKGKQKEEMGPEEEYKFAKFNTTSNPYSYSSEEYVRYLRDDDWSREETDHLFDLCHKYDLRFIVIHDRWEFDTKRSVEDLKARYFSVCRRLIRSRPSSLDERERTQLQNTYGFDKNREVERKAHLATLLSRTPQQIQEEQFLYVESRRLEQNAAKIQREREDLQHLLTGGSQRFYAWAASQAGAGAGVNGLGDKKKGKKKDGEVDGSRGEDSLIAGGGREKEAKKPRPNAAEDLRNCIVRYDESSNTVPSSGVHLRSLRITQPKASILPKVTASLTELGIGMKLVMPTKGNVERLESLMGAIATLVELKRQVDRCERELEVLKREKGGSGPGAGEDEAEGSTTKRSASVSSADANVRASKRPKKS